jgi:hypothetical protein
MRCRCRGAHVPHPSAPLKYSHDAFTRHHAVIWRWPRFSITAAVTREKRSRPRR